MDRPLADLHRHIDGAVRRATLEELASRDGRRVPYRLELRPGAGLDEALARFRFILERLQRPDDVRRIAAEACEDAVAEGVGTLELRLAPQNHRGDEPEAVIDAALDGIEGRAGLVLCGLYGERPAVLERLVEAAASRPGVVGIDLAGEPQPAHHWIMEDYARAFRRAAELGLGRTVHASEGRPAEEIGIAVEALGAQRIGQGTTLLEDPVVIEQVLERGVVIECCLTSNIHTGAAPSLYEHPLGQWIKRGVRVVLGTDNPLLSATTAPLEHERALEVRGVDRDVLDGIVAAGHEAAFRRS